MTQHPKTGSAFRRHRFIRVAVGILFAVFVVVLMDILVKIVFCLDGDFRGMKLPPYDLVFTERQHVRLANLGRDNPGRAGKFDSDLGWSLKSSYRGEIGPNNSAGFRANKEYSLVPPSGITRIAAFGDSYTHSGMIGDIEDTWAHLLEKSRPNLEVLNFGVSGYGTDQAYLRYLRDGARYHPQIVIIGFMVENLLRNVSVYRPAYYHQTGGIGLKPRFRLDEQGQLQLIRCPAQSEIELKALMESGSLIELVRETDYWVQRAPLAYVDSPVFASSLFSIAYAVYENRRPLQAYYADSSSEPFLVTFEVIRRFHNQALKDGAERAVVVVFPDRQSILNLRDGKPRYWQPMVNALQAVHIPVVDVSDSLISAIGKSDGAKYFARSHYSPAGDAVVAKTLSEELF